MDELDACLKQLCNNKAAGPDGIPSEVWKIGTLKNQLLETCNSVFSGDKPTVWSLSGIIPIPKKGDLSDTENYRGVSLTVIAAKIYNKMLLKRIRPHIEHILRKNQNGFRPGRSTTSQILALRRIIEGVKARNLPCIITFVDFKKAFDSVDRAKMFTILSAYGIPEKIIQAISIMYENTKAKVLSPDGETEYFDVTAGVLQGDTLAPLLFIIIVDYILRQAIKNNEKLGFTLNKTTRRNQQLGCNTISDLDYADDLALLADIEKDAQALLTSLEKAAAPFGLYVNHIKTEVMPINTTATIKTVEGKILKIVEDFKYLGAWVDTTARDIEIRKALAWAAIVKLDKVWQSNMSRSLKIEFFRATVEKVLLYGAEAWTLTETLEKRLDGCYTRLLRYALNIRLRIRTKKKDKQY